MAKAITPMELRAQHVAARPAQGEGEASSGWPGLLTIPKVPTGRYRSQALPTRKLVGTVPNARESADTPR
jgi:hypothetical protein